MGNKVSIVIIGRNEEQSVGRCLSAAIKAGEQIGGAEIIFVDSASTDKTVSIVKSFGIRVLSLKSERKLTPSAGRFVGSQYAQGDFILFLDADTLIYTDFLPAALTHFQNNPKVGGVNGRIDDADETGEILLNVEERFESITDVKWLRGPCCFYRKKALLEAGSFNPHLAVEEEAELGLRLIKHGWKLQLIPLRMACHTRCYHMQTLESVISIFKRDIIAGRLGEVTKTIGCAFKEGFGLAFCWLRLKTTIIFFFWLILLSLCLVLPPNLPSKTIFIFLIVSGVAAIFGKKRSIKQTLLFALTKILNFIDLLAGLPKLLIKNPKCYSLDIIEL
ncbi:MAG: putative b-glycosyltransferase, Glycosyltransferase Family 2 [Acidobacteria bacterium]|jgi:glycosyltransferase involved in cell wall biosynthesis|nr:putative b-glycosyltransferase, Glycosyltransferase Family 2 [Acidobacteriota bacterium]